MTHHAERIMAEFALRGIRAEGFIYARDLGDAIVWEAGYVRDEPVRKALEFLLNEEYLLQGLAGLILTQRGYEACQRGLARRRSERRRVPTAR